MSLSFLFIGTCPFLLVDFFCLNHNMLSFFASKSLNKYSFFFVLKIGKHCYKMKKNCGIKLEIGCLFDKTCICVYVCVGVLLTDYYYYNYWSISMNLVPNENFTAASDILQFCLSCESEISTLPRESNLQMWVSSIKDLMSVLPYHATITFCVGSSVQTQQHHCSRRKSDFYNCYNR